MSSFEQSRYPRWDARFEETRHQAEEAIEQWYAAHADQSGHPAATDAAAPSDAADGALAAAPSGLTATDLPPTEPAEHSSWFERAGEEIKVLYNDVKERILDAVGGPDYVADDETHAEFKAAWDDDEHWQARVRETAQKLEQEGRFGHRY